MKFGQPGNSAISIDSLTPEQIEQLEDDWSTGNMPAAGTDQYRQWLLFAYRSDRFARLLDDPSA